MNYFLDCDGCIADYDKNVIKFFGKHPRELTTEKLWELVNNEPDFWPSIEKMDEADRLWEFMKPFNPTIITGCPKDNFEQAAAHKKVWIKKHFGEDVEVITCLARDKQIYMKAKNDILVDDFMSNIKRWRKAGGVGIWHRNVDQTIMEFNNVLQKLEREQAIIAELLNDSNIGVLPGTIIDKIGPC